MGAMNTNKKAPSTEALSASHCEAATEKGVNSHGSGRLGGLGRHAVEIDLAAIDCGKEIKQRLNGLDARVLAATVGKLADEAQRHPGALGNSLEARCSSLPKATFQVVCDGFDGGCHGS